MSKTKETVAKEEDVKIEKLVLPTYSKLSPVRVTMQVPPKAGLQSQHYEVVAYPDSKAAGGIMVEIGCQKYGIGEWRKRGFLIVQRQTYGSSFAPSGGEIVNALVGDREGALKRLSARFDEYVKTHKGQIAAITERFSLLSATLDFVETLIRPSVKASAKKAASKTPAAK